MAPTDQSSPAEDGKTAPPGNSQAANEQKQTPSNASHPTEHNPRKGGLYQMLRYTPHVFILLIMVILGYEAFGTSDGTPLLQQLSEPGASRALITLLFSVGTIWIAVLLAVAALSPGSDDQRFNRGKEILTILVGILGTIIGYYFGAEDRQAASQPLQQSSEVVQQLQAEPDGANGESPETPGADESKPPQESDPTPSEGSS